MPVDHDLYADNVQQGKTACAGLWEDKAVGLV